MVRYEIFVFCDCGDVHPMGTSVELNDGPNDKQSIGDTYKGKDIPPELLQLHNNPVCVRRRETNSIRGTTSWCS
jgi:hypothetical protein